MAKRGTKGDYGCKVPPGGTRHGCGAGNTVFELDKLKKAVNRELNKLKKGAEKAVNRELDKLVGATPQPKSGVTRRMDKLASTTPRPKSGVTRRTSSPHWD